jgi:hypothetical protein
MPARQWISMALGGLFGFSGAALCVFYAVSLPVHVEMKWKGHSSTPL